MPIAKLPPLLINQIAAGEVIERPASVVKELVENSLDAGARRVDVRIEDGGRELIRIADDGAGITEDELHLAIAPHATSKLRDAAELEAIGTLGFRGEALASIASVSRLRITTRATVEGKPVESGTVIEASGATTGEIQPAACAPGTIMEVRDLFFNTPARRKFMRAASTEFGHINETLTRIAMVNPDVAFTLTHGNRKVMNVAPATRAQRCVELLGKDIAEALLEFDAGGDDIHVWGLAGLPSIAKATGKFQYICLNGRPIRDRNLAHAIREAYRGLIPPDRHPMVVVFIEVDAAAVDVNVHPTKSEVRFRDQRKFHSLLLRALRQRLLEADLTPAANVGGGFRPPGMAGTTSPFTPSASPSQDRNPDAFVDYFRKMDPTQKGFVYQQVKADMDDGLLREQDMPGDTSGGNFRGGAWEEAGAHHAADTLPPPVLRDEGILQVHKSYLVTQDEHGLLIIDQHALHERVMFEQLRKRILTGALESQRLLMPATLNASPARLAVLEQLQPLLERIGIEAQPMGPTTLGIHAFPTLLFERKVEPAGFMDELLDKAEEGDFDADSAGSGGDEAALHEVLDMMACKAAVKAGDGLTPEELADLLRQRKEIERSSNCPHGRPTTLRLTLRDLEKQFGRS